MTKNKVQRIVAIVLVAVAVVMAVVGGIHLPQRSGEKATAIIEELRIRTLLDVTGVGLVDTYVEIAREEAMAKGKAEGLSLKERKVKAEEAMAETRAKYESEGVEPQADTAILLPVVAEYAAQLEVYYDLKTAAEEAYVEAHMAEAEAAAEAERQAKIDAGQEVGEEKPVTVDMSGFVATPELEAALASADESFVAVGEALMQIYPALDDSALKTLKPTITNVVLQQGEGFTQLYDRYMAAGSGEALTNPVNAWLIRYADDLLYGTAALIVLALIVLFYETLCKKLGIPRIVLGVFFIMLCFMCLWFDLSLPSLLSNTLVRMGMNAVMVLAMVPGIQCGISLNLGLPIGLVAGLIGGLCTIEWGIPGVWGFIVAIAVGCLIAAVCGWLYALLLNRLKGEEMSVTTYVGFSIVSLMCIAWLVLPFNSLKLRWPMGTGLRNTIGLDSTNFKHILDDFLAFEIGDFTIPTGLLLFMALMCFLMWLFTRSKTGVAMSAVGNNPRFAEATGINVDKMRIIGTVLSTVLGAIGILVYSQSYGFMQLYTAPRQMGFIAASAILIGGASTSRCKISHVIIGTFLFQGVLTLGMPVANVLVPGSTISETLRILISNGIILYALTKSGGESRA